MKKLLSHAKAKKDKNELAEYLEQKTIDHAEQIEPG